MCNGRSWNESELVENGIFVRLNARPSKKSNTARTKLKKVQEFKYLESRTRTIQDLTTGCNA